MAGRDSIHVHLAASVAESKAGRVWGGVPARNPGFTGRESLLAAIGEALASGDRAVVQALHGAGGVGKTQLAAEFAHRYAASYDIVWWLNSENAALLGEQFASLAAELSCASAGASLDEVQRAVLAVLHERERWLLVFDNAERPEDITGWLPGGGGHVLITSRAHAWLGDLDAARRSVALADDAQYSDYTDDLLEIGGEFAVTSATHHSLAGRALTNVSGAERDAAATLERAIGLYEDGPEDGEEFWFAAGVNLALVRLRSGALDAAVAALEPALTLPAEQRISDITGRLADVRRELAAPVFRRSPQARALGDQIEAFGREAVTTGLHSLTG